MISWLKGKIIKNWNMSSKKVVVLNVNGIGYEIQLLSKQISVLDNSKFIELWIHQINRDDCTNLYGFIDINQRDLFRIIISINGIGPQIGMALLEDFEVNQLVNLIDKNDSNKLTRSQGIGKRIAERLVLELKNKLNKFREEEKIPFNDQKQNNNLEKYISEIKTTLNSLGYMEHEIKDSIKVIKNNLLENKLMLNDLTAEAKE